MKKKQKIAVIVESPTKAKTITKFLPAQYDVEASFGHIRDLPKGNLGVDVEKNFEPSYVIPRAKTKQVNQLKKKLKDYTLFYLATDPDREGEAIAYHLREILKSNNEKLTDLDFKRVVFHEITKEAINDSFERPMLIDEKLLNAQTARRVLDRLVGYKLSPLLWQKIRKGLSAGRVQSTALRLIVEREREIQAFKPDEYWEIEGDFFKKQSEVFRAKLHKKGPSLDKLTNLKVSNEGESQAVLNDLKTATYQVSSINEKEVKKNAYPPFITSSMQQAAINLYGFSAKRTMSAAQGLFEKGLITYMRTDSVTLSEQAITSIRGYVETTFGKDYLPGSPLRYKSRSKVAQEAHEAIRMTDVNRTPEVLDGELAPDEKKLYGLIWKRTLASQMNPAIYKQRSVDITTQKLSQIYLFHASGSEILFAGWKKVYNDESKNEVEFKVPELILNEGINLKEIFTEQKFTQPPARFNEASLIKALEEHDIGRPSTYAPTISTLYNRFYIEKEDKRLLPTEVGFAVTDFLFKNFPDIVDYDFTAEMEENLDSVARGEKEWQPLIAKFYTPFEKKIDQVAETAEKIELQEDKTDEVCEKCGKSMVVKVGRFGRFLACSGYPECKNTKPLIKPTGIICPDCGAQVVLKRTRKGRKFYGCSNYPECKFASWKKPGEKQDEEGEEKVNEE